VAQAESDPITAETFAAFATFLGTPLPENPIEALRAFLDALGGDPDLEPTMGYVAPGYVDEAEPDVDDEPSLGWADAEARSGRYADQPFLDAELDQADDEPSLASPESVATDGGPGYDGYIWGGRFHTTREGNQTCWARGGREDLEGEHDGREPDVDDEDGGDLEDGGDTEAATPPSPDYMKRLNARRPRRRTEHGFHNLTDLDGNPVKLIRPF
jgi:hypothetical protein